MPHPSLGQIVLFTPADVNHMIGPQEWAAIVGQVMTDPKTGRHYLNLFVLPPGRPPRWEDSVTEGHGPRSWRWPPHA